MKRFSAYLLLIFTILILGGCEIKLTAFTKINPDGSGFRITTYSADDESEKGELQNRYILPEGGAWKTQRYTPSWSKVERERQIYEAKRTFRDFNKLTPDYTRKGFNPKNLSKSSYALKVKKGFIFNTYEYKETFTDAANEKELREFCEREYNYVLNRASQCLEDALPGIITKEKIRIFLNEKYRPYFDYFLSVLLKDGYEAFFGEENKKLKEKWNECEKSLGEEGFSSLVADHVISEHKDINKEELRNKLKKVHKKIEEDLQPHQDKLTESNYEDAFGVYGVPLFVSYPFSITVVMPGRVVNSNSNDVKINIAKWTFHPSDFFLKEYKLEAKSRKLNYFAVTVFALCLVAILILANLKSLGKLWK